MNKREIYLDFVNNKLPNAAKSGGYPVRFNHCFARIILDNLYLRPWKEKIKSPAYKNLTDQELTYAIKLAAKILKNPEECRKLNNVSLRLRGKNTQSDLKSL